MVYIYGIDEYALLHAVPIFTYVPRAVLLCTDCGVSGYVVSARRGRLPRVPYTAHVDFAISITITVRGLPGDEVPRIGQ